MLPTYISAGLGALSAAKSFFGGGNSQATKDRANANQEADSLGDIKNWYNGQKTTQDAYYKKDNATARAGADKLQTYFNTDPNNDAAYARDLARANDGLHANVAKAAFENLGQATANGQVVPGGGVSGTTAGTDAYLKALDALGTSANQVTVADENQARRVSNMENSYNLANGMAGVDYGNADSAARASGDISGQLMNYFTGQETRDQAQEGQDASATIGAIGALGGDIGKMFDPGGTASPADAGTSAGPSGSKMPWYDAYGQLHKGTSTFSGSTVDSFRNATTPDILGRNRPPSNPFANPFT